MTDTKYTFFLLIAGACLIIPFSVTAFPPAVDLPQHLSQLHLLEQALRSGSAVYEVNWLAPGNLIYLLLFILKLVFPVEWLGRLISILLVLAWTGAVFWVARARNRSAESALLASLPAYSFCFYWGFVNFQLGAPLFLLFYLQLLKPADSRNWWALLGWLTVLYASHSFWFLLGSFVLGLRALAEWPDYRLIALRLSPLIPPGLLAAAWFVDIYGDRVAMAVNPSAQWLTTPDQRLLPSYLVDAVFGGINGVLEPLVATCILFWLVLAVVSNRGKLRDAVDRPLLLLACLLLVVTFFAPDRYLNSILLARRFVPLTVVVLLLALPAPVRIRGWLRSGYPIAVMLLFAAGMSFSWFKYDRDELTGFEEALSAIPEGPDRVLGLDYIQYSSFIKGRPFMQLFSYAQAYKGAELNFSFAEHGSSLVGYAPGWRPGWTGGLEWYPERTTARDLCQFDYVLINAEPAAHAYYAELKYLQPLTTNGRWRLYSSGNAGASAADACKDY